MLEMIVWGTIAMSFAVTFYLLEKQGFTRGGWTPFFCILLLVPAWFEKLIPGLGGLGIDPRTACSLALLLMLLLQPVEPGKSHRWLLLDSCLILIVLSQVASQLSNNDLRPMTMPDLMRTVGLPYFIGRILLRSPYDVFEIGRVLCLPIMLVSTYALAEAISHHNLVFEFFDSYTQGLDRSILFRWGLKRAMAMVGHPIYLSLLLSMMLPFVLEVLHQWRTTRFPWWGWMPACFCIGGILCTVSRSGQIAVAMVLLADFFFRFPRYRFPVAVTVIVGTLVVIAARDEIVALLEKSTGEAESATEMIIIKGEQVAYNGTRHRDLLHLVYADEVEAAGWFGWSYHFLDRIPPTHQIPNQFRSIDDHYLITQLRYGTVGVIVFLLFTAVGGYCFLRVAFDPYHPAATVAGTLFGAFIAVAVMVRGVAMEGDIGFPWYFIAGLGGRLYSMRLDALDAAHRERMIHQAMTDPYGEQR
jgi:hypothetical protein